MSPDALVWQEPVEDKDLVTSPLTIELDYMEYASDGAAQTAYRNSQYPPEQSETYVKASTKYSFNFSPYYATSPVPLTGDWGFKSWLSGQDVITNQRFHIDLGLAKIITKIYYENMHQSGINTNVGVKNFTFWGSNSASSFAELTYGTDTGWTQITPSQSTFDEHVALDQADPKYITITNSTAYRYYAFKFADNYGSTEYMGVRHIGLQVSSLQCYSESSIKNQGSYSLKVIAAQTDSLNNTLTKSGFTIDFTDKKNTLKFDVYASRTGTNLRMKIHDSGGTTSTKDIVISVANTWETTTWDISGIADVDKDDIGSIIIEVINADSANTFYVDNFKFEAKEGDRYIIAGIGGDWSAGAINDIAQYVSSAWNFYTPQDGWKVHVKDENKDYEYSGSTWQEIGTASDIKDAIDKKHTANADTDLDATFEATFVKKVDNVNVLADISSPGANIEDAVTKKHEHSNKTVLDAIQEALTTALKTAYDDAVTKAHEHTNKSTLDLIEEAFTSALKTAYDSCVTNEHTHANKTTLDSIEEAFTTALKTVYDSCVTNEHTHSNKVTLDNIQEALTTALKTAYDNAVTHAGLTSGNPHNVTVDQLDLASGTVASDINDAISKKHDRQHDLNAPADHSGIAGTEDNFMALDTNGLPKDSGHKDTDYADASHTHLEADITDLDHYDSTDFNTDFATKNISDLLDVLFDSGTPTDNQVLTYDNASGKWKAEVAQGGASQLSDLSDVGVTTPTNKNVLVADGDSWESRALLEADISDLQTYLKNILEDTTPQLGGDLDLNGFNIDFPSTPNISDCLDEDDMASDSATMLVTQQSIKKYVDNNTGIDDFTIKRENNELKIADRIELNTMLNAFRIAINGSLSQFNMIDGIIDEYEDETGVDTVNSLNEDYDEANDLYKPLVIAALELDYMEYATDGAAQAAYVSNAVETELDYMEYATDGAAQLAYVSSDVGGYAPQYPTHDTDHVKATTDQGAETRPWFATDPALSLIGSGGYTTWLALAGEVTNQRFHIDLGSAKIIKRIYYENYHTNGSDTTVGVENFTFWGSNTEASFLELTYGTDTGWTQITPAQSTFDQHVALNQADPKYITVTNTTSYRYYAFKFADNHGGVTFMGLRHVELQSIADNLQCYSESSIKTQGSYSLKAVATITDSLNDTLTKSGLSLDLSGISELKIDFYAGRTGTNLQVQIHDSGGTTSTKDIAISSANEWETTTWDISAIAGADKDNIDQIIIKIINADNANTFYVDNFRVPGGLQCYSENTIKQQGSYSLKAVAEQTLSLNKTLTKSGLSLDLTDKDELKIDFYAGRTGTNIQMQLKQSVGYGSDITSGQTYIASSFEPGYPASQAFDDIQGDKWRSDTWNTTNEYVGVQFSSAKIITKINILTSQWTYEINHCKLEASNNGSDWVKISANGWDDTVLKQYNTDEIVNEASEMMWGWVTFNNSTAYLYYRLFIYDNKGHSIYITVAEMEMMETGEVTHTKDIIISLTDTWETTTWDISGIDDVNKDDIDSIIIKIINADNANTFYVDNFRVDGETLNMTLISNSFTAETAPDDARIVLFEEDVDSIILQTDLKAYISRDGGSTYAQVTLTDEGDYQSGKRILTGVVDLTQSGVGSGTNIEYKIETLNNKSLKLHGCALHWD